LIMFSCSWLFVNRLYAGQSRAVGERSSGGFWFDAMTYAAIRVEAARPLKYTSSGVLYCRA
jgi:hypothetical protein